MLINEASQTKEISDGSIRYPQEFPPIDANIARIVLNSISCFFITMASCINAETINHSFSAFSSSYTTDHVGAIPTKIYTSFATSNTKKETPQSESDMGSIMSLQFEYTKVRSLALNDLYPEVHKAAGRIMQLISASNWPLVFQRIQNKLQYLSQISNQPASSPTPTEYLEKESDYTELRFIEWCDYNRERLAQLITELSANISLVPKKAMALIAVVLRRSIWCWIEGYPAEFASFCSTQKRFEGGPEVLFEAFASWADKRKQVYWPTMLMLLLLHPDILFQLSISSTKNPHVVQKTAFVDGLRKGLRGPKNVDISVVCYVDFCRASLCVSKNDANFLKAIAGGFDLELRVILFLLNTFRTNCLNP